MDANIQLNSARSNVLSENNRVRKRHTRQVDKRLKNFVDTVDPFVVLIDVDAFPLTVFFRGWVH